MGQPQLPWTAWSYPDLLGALLCVSEATDGIPSLPVSSHLLITLISFALRVAPSVLTWGWRDS